MKRDTRGPGRSMIDAIYASIIVVVALVVLAVHSL